MAGISMDSAFTGVCKFVQRARANLEMAHDTLIESCVNQTHYANLSWQQEPDFEVGDMVYLSTKNLSVLKGRARKLVPKYIGPCKLLVQTWRPLVTCLSFHPILSNEEFIQPSM